ncbi:MAG: OmpA family protein [Bacteroidetes bacterium]|nr:OmpA family protein [Bacteroidota bacterium]
MKKLFFIAFIFVFATISAQNSTFIVKPGDKAPGFVLNQQNSLQSFTMPYLNSAVLLHFWSTAVPQSKVKNKAFNRLAKRYKSAIYKNVDGFELIAIAVQADKKAWIEEVKNDSLDNFINGIAQKGFADDVCKKYGVTSLPADVLIDENGYVIAINPKITMVEDMLDEKKNFLPIKKDIEGTIAHTSNKDEYIKYGKLYLFDAYYDSIATTIINGNGGFSFYDIKLNKDFILKTDNKSDIVTTDPLAVYNTLGQLIAEAKTMGNGFVFYIPSNVSYKLTEDNAENALNGSITQINVTKNLTFGLNGVGLTPKDEQTLQPILAMLQKNKELYVELTTHTDSKPGDKAALDLTTKQAKSVKDYFIKKGVAITRIKAISKGKTEPRKVCKAHTDCTDNDHKQNRRVEFLVSKN